MGNKFVVIIIAIAALVLLGMGIVKASRGNGDESSVEDSAVMTEKILVPSSIPSRLHMTAPEGFTETSSEAFEKYYIRNDASVIVTGEKQPGIGAQLDSYIEQVKTSYAATADEYSLVLEDIITVNDLPCGLLEFTYAIVAPDTKQVMQCMTGLFVKDDYVYVITCKSRLESYSNYREIFQKTIQSVTIDDEEIPSDAIVQGETALTTAEQTTVSAAETKAE